MQKIIFIGCLTILLNGCFWQKSHTSQDAPAALQAPATQTAPAVPPPAQAAPAVTEQAHAASVPAKKATVKPVSTAKQTSSVSEIKPAAQELPPAPDTRVFDGEELLPLEGRRLGPLAALVPTPDTDFPAPWQGEQLKYGLYFSFMKVGTAYIKNRGVVDIDGQPAYLIQTTAFSAPVIDTVFKVRDINLSWLDARNFYSLGYSQSLREGRYRRDEWVQFHYPQNTYSGEVDKKSGRRALSGTLTQPVLDMLTALYFVRGQTLQKGKDVVFDILNREEQYPLVVKVIKRETVKTPAGKFKCLVVEPQFRGEGIFVSKGKSLQVWLTDDERKLPVKMKTEVFIGSVSAELLEYRPN